MCNTEIYDLNIIKDYNKYEVLLDLLLDVYPNAKKYHLWQFINEIKEILNEINRFNQKSNKTLSSYQMILAFIDQFAFKTKLCVEQEKKYPTIVSCVSMDELILRGEILSNTTKFLQKISIDINDENKEHAVSFELFDDKQVFDINTSLDVLNEDLLKLQNKFILLIEEYMKFVND